MNVNTVMTIIVSVLGGGGVVAVINAFANKRKVKVDADGKTIENAMKLQDTAIERYKEAIERMDKVEHILDQIRKERDEVRKELYEVRKERDEVRMERDEARKNLDRTEAFIRVLVQEFKKRGIDVPTGDGF